MIFVAIVCAVFAAIMQGLDVSITDRGLRGHDNVLGTSDDMWEGNDLIQAIFGKQPSLTQLYVYSVGEQAVGMLCLLLNFAVVGAGSALAASYLAIMGFKHLQGYRAWKKLGY